MAVAPGNSLAAQGWETRFLQAAPSAASSSAASLLPLPCERGDYDSVGVLAPLGEGASATAVVCLAGEARSQSELLLTAQLAAAEFTAVWAERSHPREASDSQAADVPQDVVLAAAEGDVDRGYDQLAANVQGQLDCDSVVVGAKDRLGRRCRLRAISGIPKFQRHSQIALGAEELLNEALLRDAPSFFDQSSPPPTATDAQKQLASLCQAQIVVSGPIRSRDGDAIGAWILLRRQRAAGVDAAQSAAQLSVPAEGLAARLGPAVELLQRCRPHRLPGLIKGISGQQGRGRRRTLLYIAVGLFLVMAAPLPYRVKCDCEVQAISRRYVPVPYAGVLQEVLVEPGDVVQPNQVLARMDGREIAWELAARQAEYEQAKKRHDVELAGQNAAAAQVAALEMERLDLQIQLLQNRQSNLDIRSPIAGVVIRGDAKQKQSARMSKGDTLFEVGPLQKLVVDVLVPDQDVAYVQPEQSVKIRLDAFPGEPRYGTIRRVSPQAEPRAQQSVFVAEVELDNGDGALRPGMMGRCRVSTVMRPLAWNLFHRAWDRLVYLVAW